MLSKPMGHELTQSQLAGLCGLDKTTMVVTIDELERAGLAERRLWSTDRRARIISGTEAGERVVEHGREIVARIYDDLRRPDRQEQEETAAAAPEPAY